MGPSGYMRRSSGDDVLSCCHAQYIGFVRAVEGARRLPFMADSVAKVEKSNETENPANLIF
jgi:hypothetical protein